MKFHSKILIGISLLILGCKQKQIENSKEYALIDSNRMGVSLLQTSLEKHNDFYSDSTEVAFEAICNNYIHPTQSQVPLPPMVPGFWKRSIWISPKTGQEILNSKMKAGSYIFHNVAIFQNDIRRSFNVNTKTYEENNFEFVQNFDLVPQTYITKAIKNKASIKTLPTLTEKSSSGFILEAFFDNSQHKLWLDKDTLLVRVENLRHSSTYGLGLRSFTFSGYRKIKNHLLPSTVRVSYSNTVWGDAVNTFSLNAVKEENVTKLFNETSNYILGDHSYRKMAEVVELTEHIYVIENVTSSNKFWSYNILFAEFEGYILVTEAPVNDDISELVIKKIKETIPDKPIRFLVQSHHHSDHIGGIKKYIEEGITIIASSATSEVIKKINEAPHYNIGRETIEPQIQLVDNILDLKDSMMAARVIELGPTLHSKEMLAVYFPNDSIMFQADMVNYREWPVDNDISLEFSKKIRELEIPLNMIVGLHGGIMLKDEIDKFLNGTLENTFGK